MSFCCCVVLEGFVFVFPMLCDDTSLLVYSGYLHALVKRLFLSVYSRFYKFLLGRKGREGGGWSLKKIKTIMSVGVYSNL